MLAHRPVTTDPSLTPSHVGPVSTQQSPRPPRHTQAIHQQPGTAVEMAISDDPNRVEGLRVLEELRSAPEVAHQPGTVAETAAPESTSSEDVFHGFERPERSQAGKNAVVTRSGRTSR